MLKLRIHQTKGVNFIYAFRSAKRSFWATPCSASTTQGSSTGSNRQRICAR